MVDRMNEPDPRWVAVDRYVADHLIGDDPAGALRANEAAGLPDIDVSPAHGKMLHLFVIMCGARRILEIGTLGGYSTIWLARALPEGGALVTLEIDPHRARVARQNLDHAGVGQPVDIRVGPALDTLDAMVANEEGPFDLVFIDADKVNNVAYLRAAMALSRPGTAIVVDNVIREGRILDAASDDGRVVGTRLLFEAVAAEPRLTATAVQTVGVKKWDGFMIALMQ